jgi:hypothetical protein
MVIWVITKIPINFCGYKTDKSTTDGKIHTSIIAQNLHHPDKHHRLLLPALSFSTFFQQLCYIITFQNEETKLRGAPNVGIHPDHQARLLWQATKQI